MKHLVDDYKLPSLTDPKVSETELIAAADIIIEHIARFRRVRNDYEIAASKRY